MACFTCADCGYSQEASESKVGKPANCPKCGKSGMVAESSRVYELVEAGDVGPRHDPHRYVPALLLAVALLTACSVTLQFLILIRGNGTSVKELNSVGNAKRAEMIADLPLTRLYVDQPLRVDVQNPVELQDSFEGFPVRLKEIDSHVKLPVDIRQISTDEELPVFMRGHRFIDPLPVEVSD